MAKKVLLVVASNGFHPVEYSETRSVLEKANYEVLVASNASGVATAYGDDLKVNIDTVITDINVADYQGIFIIGGPGAMEFLDHEAMHRVMQEVEKLQNRAFGAICISPRILAAAGVLQGRRVTCWNKDDKFQAIADEAGATFIDTGVVVDRNLITANGPAAATDFGDAIVAALSTDLD